MKREKLLRLLKEMLKNSKRSDREIAKGLGVSQPTITRTRARLEEEFIKTYTIIPSFGKLGYQILAFTFLKLKTYPSSGEAEKTMQRSVEWVHTHPNIIFVADGEGLGKDVVIVSLHKSYSQYSDFMRTLAMDWGDITSDFSSFLVSIESGFKMKSFDLKYLADDM